MNLKIFTTESCHPYQTFMPDSPNLKIRSKKIADRYQTVCYAVKKEKTSKQTESLAGLVSEFRGFLFFAQDQKGDFHVIRKFKLHWNT